MRLRFLGRWVGLARGSGRIKVGEGEETYQVGNLIHPNPPSVLYAAVPHPSL